jgi:hypothetical protein
MTRTALCLLATTLLTGAAVADPPRPAEHDSVSASLASLDTMAASQHMAHVNRIGRQKLALRGEASRLQAADGGTLTAAHHAYLQRKLDRINAS